jgi:hypothetical protein
MASSRVPVPAALIVPRPRAKSSVHSATFARTSSSGSSFRNLDDLNVQLRHWLDTVANPRVHATTQRVVNEAFAEEKLALKPLALAPYRTVLKLKRNPPVRAAGQARRERLGLHDHFLASASTSAVSHSAWSAWGSKSSPIHSVSSAWRSCFGSAIASSISA